MSEEKYGIVGDWLIELVGDCTCSGRDLGYGHEGHCGMEPIARVDDILRDCLNGNDKYELHLRLESAERALARVRALADRWREQGDRLWNKWSGDPGWPKSEMLAAERHNHATELCEALAEPPLDDWEGFL